MKKYILLLIIPLLSFGQYLNPVFPYTQVEGWISVDNASCNNWIASGFSLGFAYSDSARCNVNAISGFIEGSWENSWLDGVGDDAFITCFYANNYIATDYYVSLRLTNGTLTDSIECVAISVPNGISCEYALCSGSGTDEIFSEQQWYAPIDFQDFNIPEGIGVNGAYISYSKNLGGSSDADIGQVIITNNAIPIHNSTINECENQKKLIKCLNILGAQNNNNKGFQLHIYDDGSVEKKYVIE